MKSSLYGVVLLAAAGLLVGCADEAPPSPGLGGVTVNKYVAIGNSLTAGYQSSALYASGQMYSFPNLIATQMRSAGAAIGTFEQPTWPDPGNPDPLTGKAARYELISLVGPTIGPRGLTVTAAAPSNATTLMRPYDNLGLPGAPLAGFMDTVGGVLHGGFGAAIIRSAGGLPKSPHRQMVALNPDLVTFWLGANDVLGYATTGGLSPSAPTPSATFNALYSQAIGAIRTALPNAKILVGNIPDVKAVPFFTTVGPQLKANSTLNVVFVAGGYFCFQKAGEAGTGSGRTRFTESVGQPLITLVGGRVAPLVGTSTYAPWRALGGPYANYATAQALGIDSTQPFGLHPANPFPNAYVLDSLEQTIAVQAVANFNETIATVAAANNAKLVDFHGFFNEVASHGVVVSGQTMTTAYITGGLFSLDGVHPSSRGYGVIANKWIEVMNREYGMSIPAVDIAAIPGLLATGYGAADTKGFPNVDPDLLDSFRKLFKSSTEF